MSGAQTRTLADGRLHLHHGPIDLILRAEGPGAAAAHDRAVARFSGLLAELVAELPALRQPVGPGQTPLRGPVARRMGRAAASFAPVFVTPMAGVAGAVAEAVLMAMTAGSGIIRAYVNNGGDIALHLSPGAAPFRLGVVVDPARPVSPGRVSIAPDSPGRGVATSGRHGRSLSLGIADSVTVLAADAPTADVAATLIANAVDLPGDPAVTRAPARSLQPDSDLGDRLVTTALAPLSPRQITSALDAGEAAARAMRARGLILGAVLVLGDRVRIVGPVPLDAAPTEPLTLPAAKGLAHA
jgi:uncharacterized protein